MLARSARVDAPVSGVSLWRRVIGVGRRILSVPLMVVAAVAALPATTSGARRAPGPSRLVISCFDHLDSATRYAAPRPVAASPSADALATFAVLRRAASQQDTPPAINTLGAALVSQLSTYDTGYVRQLMRTPDGTQFFLATGLPPAPPRLPAACLTKLRGSEKREFRRALGSDTPATQQPVLCAVELRSVGQTGGPACGTLAEIRGGWAIGGNDSQRSITTYGLVPDGVSTVVFEFNHASALSAQSTSNFFVLSFPPDRIKRVTDALRNVSLKPKSSDQQRLQEKTALDAVTPTHILWLAGDGHAIAHFPRPTSLR